MWCESLEDLGSNSARRDVWKFYRDDLNSACCRESCECHRLVSMCCRLLNRQTNWQVSLLSVVCLGVPHPFLLSCPTSYVLSTCRFPLDPEAHKPAGMEEKLRRPFFSASLSSPSPRSNPTRRRPIKHDSWVGHTIWVQGFSFMIRWQIFYHRLCFLGMQRSHFSFPDTKSQNGSSGYQYKF